MDDHYILTLKPKRTLAPQPHYKPEDSYKLIYKLYHRKQFTPYLLYKKEIDNLDENLKSISHKCSIGYYCNVVGHVLVEIPCDYFLIEVLVDAKRKYEIKLGLIERLESLKKIKAISTFISFKKVCPDIERLISEYL